MESTIETSKIRSYVALIGDVLVEKEAGDDLAAIRDVIQKDFTDSSFARGFMLGATSILNCDGIPVFLSGEGARELRIRIMAIAKQFEVIEVLEKRGTAA